jgi:hypothetical protein
MHWKCKSAYADAIEERRRPLIVMEKLRAEERS